MAVKWAEPIDMTAFDNVSLRPRTVLHLGMPKTATTLLQECLFARHSELEYLSKCRNPKLRQALSRGRKQKYESTIGTFIECAKQEMESRWRAGKTCVYSKEVLTGVGNDGKRRQSELFRRIFGSCRILITIREPPSFIESLYFQDLKALNTNPSNRQDLVRGFGKPPRYFSIDEWFAVQEKSNFGAFGHLRVADTVEIYAETLGKENVHVVIFEKLKRNPREFLADICSCLDVSLDEAISLCEGQARNVRWTQTSIERLKRLEISTLARCKFHFSRNNREKLARLIGAHKTASPSATSKARVQIDSRWRAMIEEIGRQQSQRLVDQWGLPLAEYGYPVTENYKCGELAAA